MAPLDSHGRGHGFESRIAHSKEQVRGRQEILAEAPPPGGRASRLVARESDFVVASAVPMRERRRVAARVRDRSTRLDRTGHGIVAERNRIDVCHQRSPGVQLSRRPTGDSLGTGFLLGAFCGVVGWVILLGAEPRTRAGAVVASPSEYELNALDESLPVECALSPPSFPLVAWTMTQRIPVVAH